MGGRGSAVRRVSAVLGVLATCAFIALSIVRIVWYLRP